MDNAANCQDVLLYDGVCALCNTIVKFVLANDRAGRFCYASLASDYGREAMSRHGAASEPSVGLLINAGTASERLLLRSNAIIYVLRQFGGAWKIAGSLLNFIPRPLRDFGYSIVAKTRYRIFARYDVCPLPPADVRSKFIGL
jgi:predicted DCC family thiol-disulfide oxidoreductase YuxK